MKKRLETAYINRLFLVLPILLFTSSVIMAQDKDQSVPPPENEIVCYAAKKKWVCAPANERQKAHDKAMEMVADNEHEEIEQAVDNNVEIQTMKFNDEIKPISEQTTTSERVSQSVIEEQTQDFIPRDSTNNNTVEKSVKALETKPESIENTSVINNVNQVESAPLITTESVGAASDFNDWKKRFAERWSFQVIGTSNRHHLDDFIQSNGLSQTPHAIVKTQANGADWWVVLAGLYESRDEAINRRQELPSQLASNAWVRQIKAIIGVAD